MLTIAGSYMAEITFICDETSETEPTLTWVSKITSCIILLLVLFIKRFFRFVRFLKLVRYFFYFLKSKIHTIKILHENVETIYKCLNYRSKQN